MVTTVRDIKSVNWQLSIGKVGDIAQAIDDIRQAIGIALITSRGSDPLRPEFGSDIYQYIDKPVNTAAPAIVREILEAVELWERRVRARSVVYRVREHILSFEITLQLVANSETTEVLFEIDSASRRARISDTFNSAHSDGFSLAFS